jgi:MarR family transcriptional repressor of mepA
MKNIGQQIKITARAFNAAMDRFARQYDLTGTQLSIIDFLGHRPDHSCKRKDIEQEFDIRRSTATQILQRMKAKGLIDQLPSPTDGRQKVIVLTKKGAGFCPAITAFIEKSDQRLEKRIDLNQLREMLSAVNEVMNQ